MAEEAVAMSQMTLVVCAKTCTIQSASPAWLKTWGYADGESEVVDKPASILTGAGTCSQTAALLWSAIQAGRQCAVRMVSYCRGDIPLLTDVETRPLSSSCQKLAAAELVFQPVVQQGFPSLVATGSAKDVANAQAVASTCTPNNVVDMFSLPSGSQLDLDGDPRFNHYACVATEVTRPWRIVAVNSRWSELTGYSAAEAIGKTCKLLQCPDTCTTSLAALHHACLLQRPLRIRLLNVDKNGTQFLNTLQMVPWQSNGLVKFLLGFTTRDSAPQGLPMALHAAPRVDNAWRQSASKHATLKHSSYTGLASASLALSPAASTINSEDSSPLSSASPLQALLQSAHTAAGYGMPRVATPRMSARHALIEGRMGSLAAEGSPKDSRTDILPSKRQRVARDAARCNPIDSTETFASANMLPSSSSVERSSHGMDMIVAAGYAASGDTYEAGCACAQDHACKNLLQLSTHHVTQMGHDASLLGGSAHDLACSTLDVASASIVDAERRMSDTDKMDAQSAAAAVYALDVQRTRSSENLGSTTGSAGCSTQSGESAHSVAREKPPPFLTKLLQILETPDYSKIVRWATSEEQQALSDGAHDSCGVRDDAMLATFVVCDSSAFAKTVLPKYFKHNKLSSFVQQLYTYGFRRCPSASSATPAILPAGSTEKNAVVAFAHNAFRPGRPDLLGCIKRGGAQRIALAPATSPSTPSAQWSFSGEGTWQGNAGAVRELHLELDLIEVSLLHLERAQRDRIVTDNKWLDYLVQAAQRPWHIHAVREASCAGVAEADCSTMPASVQNDNAPYAMPPASLATPSVLGAACEHVRAVATSTTRTQPEDANSRLQGVGVDRSDSVCDDLAMQAAEAADVVATARAESLYGHPLREASPHESVEL
mmetsp:Transcript_32118/g.53084  ORF Transcript_32118/g.53084 Transcript_32118/m.53084 type:complete len:886 (-) Transcript_32118:329-2986(-)